ncbi:MAG: secondary thiamine-phosphate synthase enzyme YjbQ [Candidatus Firestonebacteria bacterium]
MMKEIELVTAERNEFKDITHKVLEAVDKAKIMSGLCYVFVPHTTAGITINENSDPAVRVDILNKLSGLVPRDDGYEHAEGNSDAHVKALLMGFSIVLPIEAGELVLGTWQGIYFCEFDGPKERKIIIKLVQTEFS